MPDRPALALEHVTQVVSAWTGIPQDRLTPGGLGARDTSSLRERLRKRVFGQDHAIDAVVAALERRFQLPEADTVRRPVWSAILAGPSGVGKTELGRSIAAHFFGETPQHLIKIDLSELREEHTVARLVGSPPGYVGHGQGGQLTNALRRCSSAVILLDELGKAHPTILNQVVLPLVGEGVVHDMNDGREIDASNAIVILTTNLGAGPGRRRPGFDSTRHTTTHADVVRRHLAPEILGRVDDLISLAPLSSVAIQAIWDREIASLHERLGRRNPAVGLVVDPAASRYLLNGIGSELVAEGARAVLRHFQRVVVDPALDALRAVGGDHGAIALNVAPSGVEIAFVPSDPSDEEGEGEPNEW